MTVGVIINPKSGRGRGKGLALAQALASTPSAHVNVLLLENFALLEPTLEVWAAQNVTDVFISSGDGTVQAIQTWLGESGAFARLPRLCLLPHGTTNMTANDLGFQRTSIADQAAFINAPKPTNIQNRHTLRIVNPKGRTPVHGMFFGTGAVADATAYCQRAFNDKGVGGNWATFATLATALGKTMFLPANANDANRFDRPYPITLNTDGHNRANGQNLLMLATTLHKLILGSRPFWGGSTAPIRTTLLPYPVPSIPRWVVPLLYGSESRKAPPGAMSHACHQCAVISPTRFVLDGEFYDPPDNEALRLETGPQLDYILR